MKKGKILQLKKCPICGREAEWYTLHYSSGTYIACAYNFDDHTIRVFGYTPEEAAEKWNTRPSNAEELDEVEELDEDDYGKLH